MFACGASNFSHMDHDDPPPSSPPTPKPSSAKKKHNKNPYAARGLDKFSMVVAELETKRERIIARTGAQGVAMIRFMCDNSTSQGWVPIVVRPKEAKPTGTEIVEKPQPQPQPQLPAASNEKQEEAVDEKLKGKKRVMRWRESYYWPVVMVMILLCLVMFGRAFAICCTSVWWYMAPNEKRERFVLRNKKLRSPRAAHGIGKKG